MLQLQNISVSLDMDSGELRCAAAKKLKIKPSDITDIRLLKRSVDARDKDDIKFVVSVAVSVKGDEKKLIERFKSKDSPVCIYKEYTGLKFPTVVRSRSFKRPVICGSGPAGLFAGYVLSKAGAAPIIIERGNNADERLAAIERLRNLGIFDPSSNMQFGEGGAGTFSDGKLTTNTHDPKTADVLHTFVSCGAPEEILWQAKPHIGTDRLPEVVKNIRKEIENAGGEVRFLTRLTDINLQNDRLCSVTVQTQSTEEAIETDSLILAAGHSARDIFALMHKKGADLLQKAFSIGVRIEHKQSAINLSQYGSFASHKALPPADYKLFCHLPSGRSVYTFCMCPGGYVMPSASEEGMLVTNGMSRFLRDGENANSAFLVNVVPEDFESENPTAGVEFQRKWESQAFLLGGGNYHAPVQLLGDFLAGIPSSAPGNVIPTYMPGVVYTDLSKCLPDFATASLREAAHIFDRRLHGFAAYDAVMTGIETRSSSPVRIVRDDTLQSNLRGVFPCGEGAGYAGGIMSAAVDGIRIANAVLAQLSERT